MDDTDLKDSDDVVITQEPDYRYGPQVRLTLNHKKEAKISAVDIENKKLEVYQHTPKWALQAVQREGYETVYIHDHSHRIDSYQELIDLVKNHYN